MIEFQICTVQSSLAMTFMSLMGGTLRHAYADKRRGNQSNQIRARLPAE